MDSPVVPEEETCKSNDDNISDERYCNNNDWDTLIQELEEKYKDVEIPEDSPTAEEILAMFDENGNRLESCHSDEFKENAFFALIHRRKRKRKQKKQPKRAI